MLASWIRCLFQKPTSTIRRTNRAKSHNKNLFRPSFEGLETREVPAFLAPVSFTTGGNTAGIAVGDFNSDGRDDMAAVNGFASSISVLISNGDGTFQPKVDYTAGANVFDATAGDLNGDGKLDVVVVGSSVNVMLGNGDGTFGAPVSYAGITLPHSVKTGDFNNDSKLDVAIITSGSAGVMLGNGDGSLQGPIIAPVTGNNINLVVGDYNRDGYLDLASSDTSSIGTVNVLSGRGDGSFGPAKSWYAFSAPVYLASGDFNHDGYDDFAVANSYSATSMSVIMNNGDGNYAAPHTYGISATGYEIEVADFNNDGNKDFAVRSSSLYMVSLGKGDGTFYPSVNYTTPNGRFEAGTHGDFNGDGAVDLAYPTTTGVTVLQNDNADMQNLAGAVSFQVTAPSTTTSGSVLPMTITAVDANGNVATGFRSLVFISSSDPAATTAAGYSFNPSDAGIPYVFTAADVGTHTFTGAIRLVTAGTQTVKVTAPNMTMGTANVSVTGQITHLDVSAPSTSNAGDTFNVTVSAINSENAVATGYTSVVHFSSSDVMAGLPADYAFTAADAGSHTFQVTLKGSGLRSIAVTELGGTRGGSTGVTVNPGAAVSFALAGTGGSIGVARAVTVVAQDQFGNIDPNSNGTVHFTSSDVNAVLPADTTLVKGVATANVTFMTVGTQTVTATDVINSSLTGTMTSDATPPIPALFDVSSISTTTAGTLNSFTVTVRDTIGQVASGYTGTMFFSSSDVQAGLPASYTFTAADAGSHTFNMMFRTAGTQSLSVRDTLGALNGSLTGITVNSAAFASFSLSVPNGADSKGHVLVTAGEAISLTVRAVDIFGNSVNGYTGQIQVSSSDALATTPGTYTFTTADVGSHTFIVKLGTATPNGVVWSFTAVENTSSISATLTNFEVVNGAATSIGVTTPRSSVAGSVFSSKVTLVDAYGNGVKNYFGTVHFSTSAINAGLPADYTFDLNDAGVHEFVLSLNTSGDQTLTVTDLSDPSLTISEITTIKAGPAAALATSTSSSAVAGVAQSFTVSAVDSYGNPAVDYRGTVVFSSSDVQAGLPTSYTFGTKDAGTHTFSVILKTAGSQSVTVNDPTNALSITQSGINVTASNLAGSFIVTGYPATTAGLAQTFKVSVKDIYGNMGASYTGTVVFSSSDVQAGLPSSYTFLASDAGVHSFSAVLKTAGTQSITVRDSITSTIVGTETGIVVTAASATASLAVAGFPATNAGAAKTFTVTARDAFGNVAKNYTGTVMFSSSDVHAGLPASYTFTAADAGIHTFTATLKTAGTQSISVQDLASGFAASETGIVVSAGAAARFIISAPTSVTQGVGFKVTVTVVDAFGNIVTGYRGKVTLSSTDPKGGTPSYSFSSKDNGVAVMSYTCSNIGLQTLKVVDNADSTILGTVVVNVLKK